MRSKIVADGYDCIAERYVEWSRTVRIAERARYTSLLLSALPQGATLLDLGCGDGSHSYEMDLRFELTAVELSSRLAAMARVNLPDANVLNADMTLIDFPEASFDGVCAFYSLIHIPRDEQGPLLRRIAVWLRPGALFVGAFGSASTEIGYEENWLGAPMFWSSHDRTTTIEMISEAGLTVTSVQGRNVRGIRRAHDVSLGCGP